MTILTSLRRFFRRYPFTSEVVDDKLPVPQRAFRWYLWFWHVFYLGALAVMSGYTLWAARAGLGWREAALVALVAGQAALYVWNFILNDRWPLPAWRLAVYFLGSAALWLIEWRLYSGFLWLGMTYLGQMFGVLPPLGAIPGTALVLFFFYGQGLNWDFSRLSAGDIVGPLLGWVSFIVLYLFIYTLSRTSEERAGLIKRLQATQRELELARAQDAELAALRERERLARDLHDSLGHALVAISVQLEAIQRLYRVDPQRATEQVEALKGVARASMDELRRSLLGLRSPGLGDQPLAEALRTLAVETGQRTGLDVACHVAGEAQRLTPAAAETLWRVAQEALTNVEKHSQARQIEIQLEVEPAGAVLRVSDDGLGLPAGAETLPEHYGLRGMRERVEGLGGTLVLALGGHAGTVVEARLPRGVKLAMDPIRILLVEDQTLMRQGLKTILDLEPGLTVVGEAGDGEEGVRQALELRPDVILMDVQMPKMTGVQATAAICGAWPEARIIILTTFNRDDYVFQGVRAGALGYLLKDTPADQLVTTIQRVHAGEVFIQADIASRALRELMHPQAGPLETLSERERGVLVLLAQGLSNREIAEKLVITEGTVKNHVSNVLGKLQAENRTQAADIARKRGLV